MAENGWASSKLLRPCRQGRLGSCTMHGKQIQKPKAEWITVQNIHEALMPREPQEAVQYIPKDLV